MIFLAEIVAADDDESAREEALLILHENSRAASIEIWERGRRVEIIGRRETTAYALAGTTRHGDPALPW
jgi:hypothetical protein